MKLTRDLLKYLNEWKENPKRKPLLLKGARQVGKSWLAKEVGNTFEQFIEINFEKRPELSSFFEGNIDAAQITKNIDDYFGIKIIPGKTLHNLPLAPLWERGQGVRGKYAGVHPYV